MVNALRVVDVLAHAILVYNEYLLDQFPQSVKGARDLDFCQFVDFGVVGGMVFEQRLKKGSVLTRQVLAVPHLALVFREDRRDFLGNLAGVFEELVCNLNFFEEVVLVAYLHLDGGLEEQNEEDELDLAGLDCEDF